MNARMRQWLAALMAALMMILPVAMAEEGAVSEAVEAEAALEREFLLGFEDAAEEAEAAAEPVANSGGIYVYARTTGRTPIFRDADMTDALCALPADTAVLVTGRDGGKAIVSVNAEDGVLTGYADAANLVEMTQAEADALQDALVSAGEVAVYGDDVNWPLANVASNASDFTKLSNDTEFVVQGQTIKASMVGNYSDCWSWARALYKIIWGTKFTSDWEGTDETGRNLIRNLTDEERQLTGDNLRKFLEQAELGCTLRICSCPKDCPNINKDGCSKHEKHSLMVIQRDDEGMVVMDNMTGSGDTLYSTRYYTYDNFASHWAKYKMIKYIKWPYAPEYQKEGWGDPKPVEPTAVSLSPSGTISLSGRQQLTATLEPEGAASGLTWKSSDPSVATVSDTGAVTPVAAGTCTVGVMTANGLYDTVTVKVAGPKKLKLEKSSVTLGVGEAFTLRHAVTPADACQDVVYASSRESVATVDENGVITGVAEGSCTIGVKAVVGGKTAKLKVNVVDSNKVTKVKLSKSGTVKLKAGETMQLAVAVTPASATAPITWGSSNEAVATLVDGTLTAVGKGSCTVGVSVGGKTAKVKVKVSGTAAGSTGSAGGTEGTGSGVAAKKVKLSKSGTVKMKAGETITVTAKLSPSNADTALTWGSTDESVARVQGGTVLAVGKGTCTIGVVTDNGKKDTFKVKVTTSAATSTNVTDADAQAVAPKKVTLSKSGTVKMKAGETITVTAQLSPSNADAALTWGSTDESVARVQGGTVLAVGKGTCTIGVVTDNGKKDTFKVKVSGESTQAAAESTADGGKAIQAIKLSKSGTVKMTVGESMTVSVAISPADADTAVAWGSSNSKVATMKDGVVKAVGEGKCTVGIAAENGVKASFTVEVSKKSSSSDADEESASREVTAVKLSKSGTVKLKVGSSLQLSVAFKPADANTPYAWKSTNSGVASVSGSGKVKAVKAGSATVGVMTQNGKYATVKIQVTE